MSVCKLVCNLYKLLTSHLARKWREEKKNQDWVPKLVTYALTWSFSHEGHWQQVFTSNRSRFGYICGKHSLTVCSHLCSYRKWWVTCVAYCVAVYSILYIHYCCIEDQKKLYLAIKHTSALWLSPWTLPIRLTGSDSISWKCEPTVTVIAGSVSLSVSSTVYTSICRTLWLITKNCAITVSWSKQLSNCTIPRRIYEVFYVYK